MTHDRDKQADAWLKVGGGGGGGGHYQELL